MLKFTALYKKVAVFTASLLLSTVALANPQGGAVTSGNATISSSGNMETINQSSQQAIINWNTFNIAAHEKTQFQQPANGVALNRINPNMGASQIYGTLTANGTVILVNGAGIHFGPGSVVNVGSLIATTVGITDSNFKNGHYIFDQPSSFSGSIINEGRIKAADYGFAALLGASVANRGVIQAKLGSIALGSGNAFTLDFYGDQLINFTVDEAATTVGVDSNGKPLTAGVSNTGKLLASDGKILITARAAAGVLDNVIDMQGIAETRSASEQGGEIILSGNGGNVVVSGKLDASGLGMNSTGGTIEVLGNNIDVAAGAYLKATGTAGGGQIYVGGNEHGAGHLQDATTTTVAAGATLNASAIDSGNGGNVIVWSNDLTTFAGTVLAEGGANAGNGGFSEVSGQQ